MGVLITPMTLAHHLHPIGSRSENKHRNMWAGWCVSSWRPLIWSIYFIYYIHTIYYSCTLGSWNKLLVRDIQTKSWYGHNGVLDDMILLFFPVLFQMYISIVQIRSLYNHNVEIGTMWRCALVSCTLQSFGMVLGFVVLVMGVIMYSFYYFLDRFLFPHDFHQNHCNYHYEFYGCSFNFEQHI